MTINEIEKISMSLSELDKLKLVEKLLESIDKSDSEIEDLWIKESEARLAAYEKGGLEAEPLSQILGNLKRK